MGTDESQPSLAFSTLNFLWSPFYGMDAISPLTPDPSPPFRRRGEDCVFLHTEETAHGTPRA